MGGDRAATTEINTKKIKLKKQLANTEKILF